MPRPLRISLFAFLALASGTAFAQPAAFDRSMAPQIQYNTGVPVTGHQKALNNGTRLRAQTHHKFVSGESSLTLIDSSNYSYSANRAGDPMAVLQFDSQTQVQQDGTLTRSIQTFNADNTVSSYRIQRKNALSGVWEDISRHEIGYKYGVRITESSTQWSDSMHSWIPGSKAIRQLNAAGQPVVFTRFFWNTERSRFDSGIQILSAYNTAGKLASRITRYGRGRLGNSSRVSYFYNAAGATTTILNDRWNSVTAVWEKEIGYIFLLNEANDRISQERMEIDGDDYRLTTEYTYSYDAYGNVTEMTGSGDRIVYTYNELGQRTGMERSPIGQSTVTESRRYFYAATSTGIATVTNVSELKVWPVPAVNALNVDLHDLKDEAYSATLSDINGRVVKSWKRPVSSSTTEQISIDALSSGTYILSITTLSGKSFQSKFSVLK